MSKKTFDLESKIVIPKPKFSRFDRVWMDGTMGRKRLIKHRRYDLDENCWYYSVVGCKDVYYPEIHFDCVIEGEQYQGGPIDECDYYVEYFEPEDLKNQRLADQNQYV